MSDFIREHYSKMSDNELCRAFYAHSGYVVTPRIVGRQRRALRLVRSAENIEALRRKAVSGEGEGNYVSGRWIAELDKEGESIDEYNGKNT